MTRKTFGILTAIGVASLASSLWAEGGNRKLVTVSSTQQVAFQPGGTINLDHSTGYLSIEGWDQPQVEITVVKTMNGIYDAKSEAAAAKRTDALKVTADRHSDTELNITTAVPHYSHILHPFGSSGGMSVDYQILVPRTSKLVIHHGVGDVIVTGVTADIEATGQMGDVVLVLPESGKYSIDAKSDIGTVSSDFDGDFHHRKIIGVQYADPNPAPAHKIYLRVGIGGITIKESPVLAQSPVGSNLQ